MNYEELSDYEINRMVAAHWLPCDYEPNDESKTVDLVGDITYLGGHGIPFEQRKKFGEFNPCSNPSDAWPIVVENKISIGFRSISSKLNPTAYWGDDNFYAVDENPLRAAMIVYLMMQENTDE